MSWAEEDWTVGLSGRVAQKVKELQVHHERLSRENKQKQLQVDNIHASLEKQTVKYEEVRGELHSVQRELQRVQEEAKAAATSRERLSQDLQTKLAQVCSLEGQLDATRTLNNKLTQEVKRLEAELEKVQGSSRSTDSTPFSTPCWSTTSPWEHSGSRKEERPGCRDEGQSRALQSRQHLQFSDAGTPSSSQPHKSTPHHHPSDQSSSFSTPLAAFPWERDDSRPAARRRSPTSPQTPSTDVFIPMPSEQGLCGKENNSRKETDMSLSALRSRVSVLEEELCSKALTMKSVQSESAQSKKELAAKELSIQRARDELSMAHTRIAQESGRASGAEQRLKQLQEELKCQRQNAESSRLQHQQRTKDLEKQHQRDLTELQKERQCLERQHQQEVNKLNQELQQARTLHNSLQAQCDKMSLHKQALDKEIDTMKEKLKWTEGQLQDSQKKEAQTQAKLTEVVREAEGVAVSLEQSRKKERALEEERRRLAEERADALRLIKELQEQKAAPAPIVQPVQFCPVGSFSSLPSYSVHSQTSTRMKTTAAALAEQKREEDVVKRRADISSSYPSDREPGEGIDSEHITVMSPDSECLQRGGHSKSNEEENKNKNEAIERDSSGRNSTIDHVLSSSSPSSTDLPTNISNCDQCCLEAKASEDLKRENAALRSELHDAREELQKRLDDLEAQRRAEAEARTRLKQLSRKHASKSVEKEEQDKEWKAQLERERAETERLRKTMAALETEIKRGGEKERQGLEEEKYKALEDRESEMIELNIQLKKQLSELKAQLALEREEREEEERKQITNTDSDLKNELSMKLEELKAELEKLKRSRKEHFLEEEKLSVANGPLMYLTLHDDELNSMVGCDNKLLPSPEQHLLFCQATNQRNMLVTQATADLIQEEQTVIDSEQLPHVICDLEDSRQEYLEGASLSDHRKALSDIQDEGTPSESAKEVKRLREENVKETERANQYQVKLEALQCQVTRQTQQLTMAFEKQTQHISCLLVELQEKESALLSQGEELQHYKQELDTLKAQREEEEKKRREEMTVEGRDGEQKEEAQEEGPQRLQPNQEKERVVTFLITNSAVSESYAQRDAGQPKILISDAERPSPICDNESQHSGSLNSDKLQSNHGIGEIEDRATTDVAAELLAPQLENQRLGQRLSGWSSSQTSTPLMDPEDEHQVKRSQNTGHAALPRSVKPSSPSVSYNIMAEVGQSENVRSCEDKGHLEREESTEEELGVVCQSEMNRLQQQMAELQTKLKTLSVDYQQQAEELAVWRLASQPPLILDPPSTDEQTETQDQIPAVGQSKSSQQQSDEMIQTLNAPNLGLQDSYGNLTVIREDELLLSCSSNKLQGHILFSRVQQSSSPESKTATLQESSQHKIDEDSEKDNQEINLLRQKQEKEETDTEVFQISSANCRHFPKDSVTESGPKNPEVKPGASRPNNKMSTTNDSLDRHIRTEMKSVSSQTEDSFCPRSVPKAHELQCASTQTEEVEEEQGEEAPVESPPVSPVPAAVGAVLGDRMLFSGSFPIPADPVRLAERIRRNRTQLSAAFDDTEYEPYGLPEVVKKGFADIPTGPSCPYIVRRGLLGTTVVPVSQNNQEQEETD